jgi:PPOX class probable F420-dependent enzyme
MDRPTVAILSPEDRDFLGATRRAVLATVSADGRPRQVPVCFAIVDGPAGATLYSPLDEKPKRGSDPRRLARVRDLLDRPHVSLLADRWDEDWTRLAWLRVDATASLVEPGAPQHDQAIVELRLRYSQYPTQRLEVCPMIRLEPTRIAWWSSTDAPAGTGR